MMGKAFGNGLLAFCQAFNSARNRSPIHRESAMLIEGEIRSRYQNAFHHPGKTMIAFQIAWKLFQARWNLSREATRRPRIF